MNDQANPNLTLMRRLLPLFAAAFLGTLLPSTAEADDPAFALGAFATADNFAATGGIEGRIRLPHAQLSLRAEGGRARDAFVAGYAVEDAALSRVTFETRLPAGTVGAARFGVHLSAGGRFARGGVGNAPEGPSRALELGLGLIATIPVRSRGAFRAGVLVPFSLEIAPEVVNDVQGALLTLGGAVALGDRLWLQGQIDTGGIFGADGDSGKFLFRGTLTIRGLFGSTTRDWLTF